MMRPIGRGLLAALVALAIGVSANNASAQVKGVAESLGVDIHGLVSGVYQYSFDKPGGNTVAVRTSVAKHDTIDLNQASLFFVRDREDSPFGFNVTLDFGTVAQTTGSDWTGDGTLTDSPEEGNSFELREAYLTYKIEQLGNIKLKAGKFVTLLGYEVIKSWNNVNYNISESILFGYSIPFTHTGILANVPIGDMVSLDIGVVNGWDNVQDNNHGKTLLAGLGITPSDMVTIYVAGTYGQEQNGQLAGVPGPGAGSKRGVITANATIKATDMLSFVVDGVYGKESDILLNNAGALKRNADWYGVAGYAIVQATDELSFNLRAEVFDDADGTRTPVAPNGMGGFMTTTGGTALNNTMWEVTPTVAYQVMENVLARLEYRHDESSKPIYQHDIAGAVHGSDTVAVELLGYF